MHGQRWTSLGSGDRMLGMAGHVFVVPGTLQWLVYDDVLVSTDYRGEVGRTWWPVFGWSDDEGPRRRTEFSHLLQGRRFALTERTAAPRRWLVDVGAHPGAPVSWLLAGIRDALSAMAREAGGAAANGIPPRV